MSESFSVGEQTGAEGMQENNLEDDDSGPGRRSWSLELGWRCKEWIQSTNI